MHSFSLFALWIRLSEQIFNFRPVRRRARLYNGLLAQLDRFGFLSRLERVVRRNRRLGKRAHSKKDDRACHNGSFFHHA